jgi:hypothetical protein
MALQMLMANGFGSFLQEKRRYWIAKIDWGKAVFARVNAWNCTAGLAVSN